MTRTLVLAVPAALALAACSSSPGMKQSPDMMQAKQYLDARVPTMPLLIAGAGDGGAGAPADLTCVGMPSPATASTMAITAQGTVKDYQTSMAIPGAKITLYTASDLKTVAAMATSAPAVDATTAPAQGTYSMTIPIGTRFLNVKVSAMDAGQVDTLMLNNAFNQSSSTLSLDPYSVSSETVTLLPALVGVTRTAGTGLLAGALLDCKGQPIENAIIVVRDASDNPVTGPQVVYFNDGSPPLPVKRNVQQATNVNGLFGVLQIPSTSSTVRIEAYGLKAAGDTTISKIADLTVPSLPDTVVLTQLTPYMIN